jgi:hypothetical protein
MPTCLPPFAQAIPGFHSLLLCMESSDRLRKELQNDTAAPAIFVQAILSITHQLSCQHMDVAIE